MTVRIVIDRDRCVGSGNCLYWAPATFDLGDDGISVVVDPQGDDDDRIRVAVEGCPTRALDPRGQDEGEAASPERSWTTRDEDRGPRGTPCRSH